MAIPSTSLFEALIGSFLPEKPKGSTAGWREFTAIPADLANQDGDMIQRPSIVIWYQETGKLSLAALLTKISGELSSRGHPANLDIAATLVAIFTYARKPSGSAVDQFNEIFAEITDADLTQQYLAPVPEKAAVKSDLANGSIGPFRLGNFNPERLEYQTTRAGSDYFERYEAALRRVRWSLERKFRPVKIVFWPAFDAKAGWLKVTKSSALMHRLLEAYFAQVSAVYFEDFFEEFASLQEIPTALGSGWIEPNILHNILGAHQISIYLNMAGKNVGFVSPTAKQRLEIDFGGAHVGVPATQEFLQDKFSFESLSESEIHQSIKSYSRFLALAEKHDLAGRSSEAFLHFVIALDLLLGDIGASTAAVSSRGAVLTHGVLKKDYTSAAKELQRIYGARSKYVHEGRDPDSTLLETGRVICREIAFALFRLQKAPLNRTKGFVARWLKDIDYVIAALEAGRPIADDDWKRIGVAGSEDVSSADFSRFLENPNSKGNPGISAA